MNNKTLREKAIALLANPKEEDSAAIEKAIALLTGNYKKPLALTAKQQACFDRAIKSGLMSPQPDGTYRWLHHSKVLLSYFCGRVFCGDHTCTDIIGGSYWKQGAGRLPAAALERLFNVKHLKQRRERSLSVSLPEGHEQVDEILRL